MKVLCILGALVLTVTAVPESEEERQNGVNGWYVPQSYGVEQWVTLKEGEKILADIEKQQAEYDNEIANYLLIPPSFYLFTNKNPTVAHKISQNSHTIESSNFDPSKPTRVVIHGWLQSHNSLVNKEIRAAWLGRGKYNVIIVNWPQSHLSYFWGAYSVSAVGKEVASMIDYLVTNHGMNLNATQVIGHSLGAHVAGFTGKNLKNGKLQAIVALDAALPLFSYEKPNYRLSVDDAQYVECIHTNGGKYGFMQPIGKADFYPNGGKTQPGCGVNPICHHRRSTVYYAEAVLQDSFPSIHCDDFTQVLQNSCGGHHSGIQMGGENNFETVTGLYYVLVNSEPPFGHHKN